MRMRVKRFLIVCAWLAAASSCAGDGIGPATSPISPFGPEPSGGAATGGEPSGGGGSIADACARACAHINSICPGTEGPDCASDCALASPPGCEAQFRAFVLCVASAPLDCTNQSIDPAACAVQIDALGNCSSGQSGGTGSAGASGTR